MVQWYRENYKPRADYEIQFFRSHETLAAAVERAALARDADGRLFQHQWSLVGRDEVVTKARQRLSAALTEIEACDSFETLHELVKARLAGIKWLAELYYYDTAFRIGAKLNLFPRYVFLHAGTRKGAQKLGLNGDAEFLDLNKSEIFPRELRELSPHEIEDFLCIFRNLFKPITTNKIPAG